jgi:hypothetical protein
MNTYLLIINLKFSWFKNTNLIAFDLQFLHFVFCIKLINCEDLVFVMMIQFQNLAWMLFSHMSVLLVWCNLVCYWDHVFRVILVFLSVFKCFFLFRSLFLLFMILSHVCGLELWTSVWHVYFFFIKEKTQYLVFKVCLSYTALRHF